MESEVKRPQAMAQPSLIYAFVARGTVILADHVDFAGSFFTLLGLATRAAQLLRELPSGKCLTYREGGHSFDYFLNDGFTYCVVAGDSIKRQIPECFLLSVKEDFIRMYGQNAATAVENSLSKEFGPKLKEHMQLCMDNSQETRRVARKGKVSELSYSENVYLTPLQEDTHICIMLENPGTSQIFFLIPYDSFDTQTLEQGEKVQLTVDNTGGLRDKILMEVQDLFTKHGRLWPEKVESAMKQLHASHTSDLQADVLAILSSSYTGSKFSDGRNQPNKSNTSNDILSHSISRKSSDPKNEQFNTSISERCRRAVKARSSSSIYGSEKVALVYNEGMLSHKPPPDSNVNEIPERLSRIVKKLKEEGIWDRCEIFSCDEAGIESLQAVHDLKHISVVQEISSGDMISNNNDMYYSEGSTKSALLAAGGVLKAVELVADGVCNYSFALVRPPGHHVGRRGPPTGFCFLNNIAIGAAHLLAKYEIWGFTRIAVQKSWVHYHTLNSCWYHQIINKRYKMDMNRKGDLLLRLHAED